MRLLLVIIILTAVILGYGYWHAATHGSLNIALYDDSDIQSFALLKDMKITLRDNAGNVLATGQSDSRYGTVYLSHPVTGSCYEQERNATQSNTGMNDWQTCFRKHSTWIMEWIDQVRLIDVAIPGCQLFDLPVVVERHNADWWMWWVPLPHVGGKPYAYFYLSLKINPIACQLSE